MTITAEELRQAIEDDKWLDAYAHDELSQEYFDRDTRLQDFKDENRLAILEAALLGLESQEDAERYRYLRSEHGLDILALAFDMNGPNRTQANAEPKLDAAIDSIRKKGKDD